MSMQIAFFSAYAASQIPDNLQNAIAEYELLRIFPIAKTMYISSGSVVCV